jgi:Protein of unknown function (DUF3176)
VERSSAHPQKHRELPAALSSADRADNFPRPTSGVFDNHVRDLLSSHCIALSLTFALCDFVGSSAFLAMSLDEREEWRPSDPRLSPYIDVPLKNVGDQREKLIQRKPVFTEQNSESYQTHGPVISRNRHAAYDGNQWEPGIWRQFPYRGVSALLFSLFCMAGSIAILYRSDGQPVQHWKISPTVYLALFTTGANMSLRFAFNQGVKISWWYNALNGASVGHLHRQWLYGDTFWSALFSGQHFNLVALASVATTLVVIDQPLIQRASTVVPFQFQHPVQVIAQIAPEIPWGYTGYQSGRGSEQQLMTGPMISAFNDFNSKNPIVANFSGCTESCTGFVNAGGLAAQCSTVSGPVTYLLHADNDFGGGIPQDIFLPESPFGVNFTLEGVESETSGTRMTMTVWYTNNATSDCTGTMTLRSCTLRPASLRYPINLEGNVLSLGNIIEGSNITSFQPASSNVVSIDGGSDFDRWTLGGLYVAANNLFASNASYQFTGGHGSVVYLPDTLSNQFVQIAPTFLGASNDSTSIYNISIPQVCSSNWADPTKHILTSLNELAFRVSLLSGGIEFRNTSKPPDAQVLHMEEISTVNVFHSEYHYLLGSSLLGAFFVLLVAPTFWGWWEIGRSVTLNPIEIAKAFDAPFFQGPGSNATERELVRNMGSRLLRYGEAECQDRAENSSRQLKLADPHEISTPTPWAVYE